MRRFQTDSRFIRGQKSRLAKGRLKQGLSEESLFQTAFLPMDAVQSVVYFQQFHFKHQRSVRRNHAACAA